MAIYDIDGKAIYDYDDIHFDDFPALKYNFNDSVRQGIINKCNLFTMAHISDIHTDPIRYYRFLKFVNSNLEYIDSCVLTGDYVIAPYVSEYQTMINEELKFPNVSILKSVGNHDKKYETIKMTNEQVYANWNQITNTGKLYYYKDYPSFHIRIIAINPYDTELSEEDSTYSQTQIDWFIDTLKSAITAEYAVIIIRHNFDGKNTVENDYGFRQRFFWWDGHFDNELICSGTPIEDIIHAFMTGGSINQTYTFSNGAPSITANTSFSSAGHFIAHLCGHNHADLVGFSPKYNDQLYLAMAQSLFTSTARPEYNHSYTSASDLPRIDNTKTQDLFNLYAFDTAKKMVKICRIGSCINDLLQERKMAVIPYNGSN